MRPGDSFKPPAALSPRAQPSNPLDPNGTGSPAHHLPPRLPSKYTLRHNDPSVAVAEARHAEMLLQEQLDRELNHVSAMYEEYFDDVGLDLNRPGATVRGTEAPSFVTYMKQIPTKGRNPLYDRKTAEVKAASATQKFQSLGAIIHTRSVDKRLFQQDYLVCGMSMLGVLLMGAASFLSWTKRLRPGGSLFACAGVDPPDPLYIETVGSVSRVAAAAIFVLTCMIFASTVVCVFFIVRYYMMILRAKQIEWCKLNGKEIMKRGEAYNFWKSKLPFYMFAEIILHMAMPYPWYYSQTDQNAKYLELFMLTRVYTILRVLHHASPLYQMRHDIVQATAELKRANFTVRFADTMKVYCYHYTIAFGLVLYGFVALIGGFAVFVAERDSNNGCYPFPPPPGLDGFGFNAWLDGIYYMVISVRTIGYGDLRPVTVVGRLSAMFFITGGMFVETFLGSVVINKIAKSRDEVVIDEYLASVEAYKELQQSAAMLIQALWKSSLHYKYRHGEISRVRIAEVLRQQKRRNEFLKRLKQEQTTFPMPAYNNFHDEVEALKLVGGIKTESDRDKWATDVALRTMVSHFKARGGGKAGERQRKAYQTETSSARDRMPYLMRKEELCSSHELVLRHKIMFTQDLDLRRWSEKVKTGVVDPKVRKFTGTKKVKGKLNERRIPIGAGHKADILLEARKSFRQARLQFTQALSTSADFVIDEKLLLVFRLLRTAAEKVRRNAIALDGLRRVARVQLESLDQVATLTLSGGVF